MFTDAITAQRGGCLAMASREGECRSGDNHIMIDVSCVGDETWSWSAVKVRCHAFAQETKKGAAVSPAGQGGRPDPFAPRLPGLTTGALGEPSMNCHEANLLRQK